MSKWHLLWISCSNLLWNENKNNKTYFLSANFHQGKAQWTITDINIRFIKQDPICVLHARIELLITVTLHLLWFIHHTPHVFIFSVKMKLGSSPYSDANWAAHYGHLPHSSSIFIRAGPENSGAWNKMKNGDLYLTSQKYSKNKLINIVHI